MTRLGARVSIPPRWKAFVHSYGANLAYWYQPKGMAITVDAVEARLRILRELEHSGVWRDLQSDYVRRLRQAHVSEAESEWDGGGAPLARMLKQVMTVLGLAWIDADDKIEILDAGNLFLEANDKAAILSRQALRYQFWNPAVRKSQLQPVRLHPVPFLVRLLMAVGGKLSSDEYRLFVSKARAIEDVDQIAETIDQFRELSEEEQKEVSKQCDRYNIAGQRRSTIYNTIKLNQSYAYKMWSLSNLIEIGENQSLSLARLRGEDRSYIDDYANNGTYIDFLNPKEFVAWMGDPKAIPNSSTALDIYIARGDLEAASLMKRRMGTGTAELKKFKRMMIGEKTLEDNIEGNFDEFSRRVKMSLSLVGRQYPTTVGPIDLLAQDKRTGSYVVIELKRGRSADKVFGQLSRYMGWVRKNLSDGADVIGVIVGSRIDDKLRAARDAHDTNVLLVEYESKMAIEVV